MHWTTTVPKEVGYYWTQPINGCNVNMIYVDNTGRHLPIGEQFVGKEKSDKLLYCKIEQPTFNWPIILPELGFDKVTISIKLNDVPLRWVRDDVFHVGNISVICESIPALRTLMEMIEGYHD